MKIIAGSAIVLCASALAADFWVSKPFTEWSEKDVQRIVENSPWAKTTSVAMESREGPRSGNASRRSMGESNNPTANSEDPMGGAGSGMNRRDRGGSDGEMPVVAAAMLVIRWQTALPIKQAMVKMKYGSEAANSEDAKKALEAGSDLYVVAVAGIAPGMFRGQNDAVKKALLEQTTLSVKGKEELKPKDIQMGRAAHGMELYFVFPKKVEFTVEDKEVEFATKFESISVKQKFKLKDMVYNGKLEL